MIKLLIVVILILVLGFFVLGRMEKKHKELYMKKHVFFQEKPKKEECEFYIGWKGSQYENESFVKIYDKEGVHSYRRYNFNILKNEKEVVLYPKRETVFISYDMYLMLTECKEREKLYLYIKDGCLCYIEKEQEDLEE